MAAAAVPLVFSGISAGVSAYGQVQAGRAQSRAYKAEAAAKAMEARVAAMRVKEISADFHDRLVGDLKAMHSMAAGKNLSGDTASTYALHTSFTEETLTAKNRAELNPSFDALNALNSRRAALQAASAAKTQGWLNATGSIIQMGSAGYKLATMGR
jgi:hypothetical protein